MGILSWILFGLVVGVIAKLLMPGRDPGGFIVTILLGIAGALIGGFVGRALGFYSENQGAGWIMRMRVDPGSADPGSPGLHNPLVPRSRRNTSVSPITHTIDRRR